MRINDHRKIDSLLFKNAHMLSSPGWFFAYDTNLDKPERWDKAKLKVLLLFLSQGATRSVSSTDLALVSIFKDVLGKDLFMDVSYLPTKRNCDILDELNLPWVFGAVSHRPISDYDVVFVSNSTVDEKYNIIPIFDKSDFPLYATQRLENPDLPLVIYGGAAATDGEPLYGKVGKHQSLVDVTYVGFAESYADKLINILHKRKIDGILKDKKATIKNLYKLPCIYNPLAYEHVFKEDNWDIKEIKKVDSDAPDKVKFASCSTEDINRFPGFELKTLYNDGNYDSVDIEISKGCSGGNVCNFCVARGTKVVTAKGFKNIEDLKIGDKVATKNGWQIVKKTHVLGKMPALKLVLNNGDSLVCSAYRHRVETPEGWVYVKNLEAGDRIYVGVENFTEVLDEACGRIHFDEKDFNGRFVYPDEIDGDLAWLAGYWYGDGCLSKSYVLAVKEAEKQKILAILKKMGFEGEWERYDGPSRKVFKIAVSRCFSRFIVAVTEQIFNTGWKAREFISGYVQADGWVNSNFGVDLVTSNPVKLEKVRVLVRALGYRGSVKAYKRRAFEGYNSKESMRYVLHISADDFVLLEKPTKGKSISYDTARVLGIDLAQEVEMFDITLDEPHQYYPNFISSHQCHEGQAHAWRQKSFEKIKKEMDAARFRSFANTYSSYSYNTNFHTHYEDIMAYASATYPKISSISMRADEIAARPDYFRMMKFIGMQRITLGLEGLSERVRNGYLNKSLSEEQMMGALETSYKNRLMQCKIFLILTGIEEKEDWDAGIDFLKKAIALRDSLGANTHLKVSFSVLCHYPHTPLAWERRASILHTLNKGKISYFIDKCREIGVGVRFSSRGKAAVYQQLSLDGGRPLTAIYEKLYRETGWVYYRSVPDSIVERLLELTKEFGLPGHEKLFGARPFDFIFPNSTIEVKNEKFLIDAAKMLRERKWEKYCLRTQASPQVKNCAGCGLCKNKEENEHMRNRDTNTSKATVDSVIANLSMNKPRNRYRFTFEIPQKFDFLGKKSLGHYVLTKMVPEKFKPHVYGVASTSDPLRWNYHPEMPHPVHGAYILDLLTREPMDLDSLDMNPSSILRPKTVKELPVKGSHIKHSDFVLLHLTTQMSPKLLEALKAKGFNEFPYIKNDQPLDWEFIDGSGVQPLFKKTNVYNFLMYVPIRANIVKFLAVQLNSPYYKVLEKIFIQNRSLYYLRRFPGFQCKSCGADSVINLADMKPIPLCPSCFQKYLFNRIF